MLTFNYWLEILLKYINNSLILIFIFIKKKKTNYKNKIQNLFPLIYWSVNMFYSSDY